MRAIAWMLGMGLLSVLLTACGGEGETPAAPDTPEPATPSPASAPEEVVEEAADPLATPKGSIEHQFELLKQKDVDALRACFTESQQKRITAEAVADGAKEVGTMTLDDLYAGEEPGEYQGRKTMKVMMKSGRSLTTLVEIDGRWYADTVWFR